jgi:hypothetical protein
MFSLTPGREEEEKQKLWYENSKENRPLGRLGNRWKDNMKMDIKQTGWEGVDWIHLAQDRDLWPALVNTVMNL